MPRRYNEDPVNLIQILPSQGKVSTPNPLKPSVTRLLLEATAAGIRGLAEMVTRGGRRLRIAVVDLARSTRELAQQGYQWIGWMTLRSRRIGQDLARVGARARQWIAAVQDRFCAQISQSLDRRRVTEQSLEHHKPAPVVKNKHQNDVASLRAQLLAQQQELAHITSQMMELKALTMSQEQVLLYLGKELDAMQMPVVRVEATAPKKNASRAKKSAKSKRVAPSRAAQKPSISL